MGRWVFILGTVLLVLAVLVATGWFLSRPAEPEAFYQAGAATEVPGTLLATEPYTRDVPAGAKAWRILYSTTRVDGSAAVASAVVMVPENAEGPLTPISWAHGTTGTTSGCAPSMVGPFGNVPALGQLLAEGWAYVATDYVGLGTDGGHAYLVGAEAGRAVLDAVRAATQMEETDIAPRTVVWGHSQGGGAALWTGMLAPGYAPDIEVLGVAGFAPATDLPELVRQTQGTLFGKITGSFMVHGYARTYDDVKVEDYVGVYARALAGDIDTRCIADARALMTGAEALILPPGGIFKTDATKGPLGARLAANVPLGPYDMPVFIGQGTDDNLVLEPIQTRFVETLCAAGETLTYRRYEGRDHGSVVAADSPLEADLIAWTRALFAGESVGSGCMGL